MSKEGFWQVSYQGAEGYGVAILVFDSGTVVGYDVTGGLVDGTYRLAPDARQLAFDVKWTATVGGVRLVQGGAPVPAGWSFRLTGTLPKDLEAVATPIPVNTEYGTIVAMFKKIRSFP